MTRKELLALPRYDYTKPLPLFDELYIIPTRRKHDSGYRIIEIIGIEYVVTNNTRQIKTACKLSTCADVIMYDLFEQCRSGFKMDVPPDCNCIRLFTFGKFRILAHGLSDFIFKVED